MPVARAAIPAAVAAMALAGGALVQAQPPATRPVTELGQRYPATGRLSGAGDQSRRATVEHVQPPTVPGAEIRYVRVYLQLEGGAGGRWYVTVRGADLRPVEVLTAESFRPGGGRWTARVDGTKVVFDLDLADGSSETRR